MEPGVQRHRSSEASKLKIGNTGFAVHRYIAQCAVKMAIGSQHSGDAFEIAKIGVLKAVIAIERGLTRIGYIPWPDVAMGMDYSSGPRIGKIRLIGDSLIGLNVSQ